MTKAEKLETFEYYLRAETCVCGKSKGPMHWSCRPCRRSHDQHPAGRMLDQACEAHVLAARAYLDVLKADAAVPCTHQDAGECPECHGGRVPVFHGDCTDDEPCERCNGTGRLSTPGTTEGGRK